MQDVKGNEQLAVRLDGESRSVEFSWTALDGSRHAAVFGPLDFLFNELWHRLLLDVGRSSVTLAVDCLTVGSRQISPRQEVSLDGFTLIGKPKDNPMLAVPVRSCRTLNAAPGISAGSLVRESFHLISKFC